MGEEAAWEKKPSKFGKILRVSHTIHLVLCGLWWHLASRFTAGAEMSNRGFFSFPKWYVSIFKQRCSMKEEGRE
jgi:hypothetical protein